LGLKLLCIVAHPDDECFAFGGALALAADQGVETHVLCLTDGQAATNRGSSTSSEDLGRMRREEFQNSCSVLGVTHHELLDYQDAQLEFASFSEAACRLVERIRGFRPNVVLTFSPDGGLNTHPDHTMVASLTTAAFHWAALEKRFPAAGPAHAADRLFHLSTDFFMPDRPAPAPPPYTTILDVRAVLDRKREAFRQHTSQAPLMERTREMFDQHGHAEYYTLAAARTPQPAAQSTSLFAGLA
jgi:LmbE family N-acetylglucosaminyl deacetylase